MSSERNPKPIRSGSSPLDELVIAPPVFGRRSFFTDPDPAELLDAIHELACGCLPGRCPHEGEPR